MKRKKNDIKKTIKRKISLENKKMGLPKPKNLSISDERRKARIGKEKKDNVRLSETPIVKVEKSDKMKSPQPKNLSTFDKRRKARIEGKGKKDNVKLSETPIIKVKSGLSVALANERSNIIGGGRPKFEIGSMFGIRHHCEYEKKENVDYDIFICIPSHDRYKKVKRLISQFYNQETKYTFKIVLLNDGSKSSWYDKLPEQFPNMIYLKNDEANGKFNHWKCYNQLWDEIKENEAHAVLQMDDDFILCDNFLDIIVDLYFNKKEENGYMRGVSPHLWSFKKTTQQSEGWWGDYRFVDGIVLMDFDVLKEINFELSSVNEKVKNLGIPVGVWNQISKAITKNHGFIFRTENSLVYHDDINGDSKLHKGFRKEYKKIIYTQKFIGNKIFEK